MEDERQVGFKTDCDVLSLSDLGNSGDWERLRRALAEWGYLLRGSVIWSKTAVSYISAVFTLSCTQRLHFVENRKEKKVQKQ